MKTDKRNDMNNYSNVLKILKSMTLSMAAHPDCIKGSEFFDLVSIAEKVIEKTLSPSEDKTAEPITISKSDGTGQLEIYPEVKALAISWIEGYTPYGSVMPEIAQKWKLAEDIQRLINKHTTLCRNKAIEEAVDLPVYGEGFIKVSDLEKLTRIR